MILEIYGLFTSCLLDWVWINSIILQRGDRQRIKFEEEKFKDIENEYFPSSSYEESEESLPSIDVWFQLWNMTDILESLEEKEGNRKKFSHLASLSPRISLTMENLFLRFRWISQFRFLFFLPRRLSIENESFLKRNWLGTSFLRNSFVPDMGRNLNFYRNC